MDKVIPYQDDPMVITVTMIIRNGRKVWVDKGSLVDILFRDMLVGLQEPGDMLRPHVDVLMGFARDQVECR